jgi:hypothetical protein
MRPRKRPHLEPELVRDADAHLLIGGGETRWDQLKNSKIGLETLDCVQLGPNSIAYTLVSIRKLIAKLPRVRRPIDDDDQSRAAPSFPRDRVVRRKKSEKPDPEPLKAME